KQVLPDIRKALKHPEGFVRASAAVADWKVSGDAGPAVEALLELLKNEPGSDDFEKVKDEFNKSWAIDGLARIGPDARATVPALVEALKDKKIDHKAAFALVAISPQSSNEAVPILMRLLREGGLNSHDAAIALGKMGPSGKDAVPALLQVWKNEDRWIADEAA